VTRAAALAALAAALAACDTRYECPGEPVTTLRFQSHVIPEVGPSTQCGEPKRTGQPPTPTPPPLSRVPVRSLEFTGTIVRRGGQAVLCVERPLAREKVGTLDAADALSVSSSDLGLTVNKCPCLIDATEVLSGTLRRTAGAVDGFTGTFAVTMRLAGGSCAPGATDACEPLAYPPGSATAPLTECTVTLDLRAPPGP